MKHLVLALVSVTILDALFNHSQITSTTIVNTAYLAHQIGAAVHHWVYYPN